MKLLASVGSGLGTVHELLTFFWNRKFWWMIPLAMVLLLVGLLLVFAQASGPGRFIYPFF